LMIQLASCIAAKWQVQLFFCNLLPACSKCNLLFTYSRTTTSSICQLKTSYLKPRQLGKHHTCYYVDGNHDYDTTLHLVTTHYGTWNLFLLTNVNSTTSVQTPDFTNSTNTNSHTTSESHQKRAC